jgi:hypothetical protein
VNAPPRQRRPRSLEEQWAFERRRREGIATAAGLPSPRDAAVSFCLALVGGMIAGIATDRLQVATIPLLIAAGLGVGLLTERTWLLAIVGATVGLPLGRDLILPMFSVNAGSFDRDAAGAVVVALCFVLPGWLFGRAARLSRRQVQRGRGSPWAYALTGIGMLVAAAVLVLWLLSLGSRDY